MAQGPIKLHKTGSAPRPRHPSGAPTITPLKGKPFPAPWEKGDENNSTDSDSEVDGGAHPHQGQDVGDRIRAARAAQREVEGLEPEEDSPPEATVVGEGDMNALNLNMVIPVGGGSPPEGSLPFPGGSFPLPGSPLGGASPPDLGLTPSSGPSAAPSPSAAGGGAPVPAPFFAGVAMRVLQLRPDSGEELLGRRARVCGLIAAHGGRVVTSAPLVRPLREPASAVLR